jgi:hypothetical protein
MPTLKRWPKRSATRWGRHHECLKRNFYSIGSVNGTLGDRLSVVNSARFILNVLKSKMNSRGQFPRDLPVARHRRCDVYCGARETVGESSVSSGCWGEDSNHENEWARHTPTLSRPFAFTGALPPINLRPAVSYSFRQKRTYPSTVSDYTGPRRMSAA